MRRRPPIDIWPAFSDLMTVLAVVAVFTSLLLANQYLESRGEIERWEGRWRENEARIEQAIRNERMFAAIQRVDDMVQTMAENEPNLSFDADQSLSFGATLVDFDINSVKPIWRKDSKEQLGRFCSALTQELNRQDEAGVDQGEFFTILVEGHSDETTCSREPLCNWRVSAARAANFVKVMKDDEVCPGGSSWDIKPIGFADTQPLLVKKKWRKIRRIRIRLVPDYEAIIDRYKPDAVREAPAASAVIGHVTTTDDGSANGHAGEGGGKGGDGL